MRHRMALIALGVVLALTLAAACGGGGGAQLTHEQYQALLDELRTDLEAQEQAFAGFANVTDPADLVAPIQQAATSSREVASRLSAVTPPADAAEAHPKLITGFTKMAELMDEFAAAAQANDLLKIQQIGQQFSSGSVPELQGLEQGIQQLRDAGYNLPEDEQPT